MNTLEQISETGNIAETLALVAKIKDGAGVPFFFGSPFAQ